ncbi:MAG TPA: hypothetical protein VGF09_00855 [Solirubrobacterales bacterium]|jgi:hypothetical protein
MRIKVALAAILGLSLLAAAAADAHKVPMGLAKGEIRRATAGLCAETPGCVNWSVGPCVRRSFHRIDCVSKLKGESGASCAFVTIARAPSHRYEVVIHHKRIFCSKL